MAQRHQAARRRNLDGVDPRQLLLTATSTAGAGVLASGLAAVAVLIAEATAATRHDLLPADSAPVQDATVGDPADPRLRVVMVGDSTAAGVGALRPGETVGRQIATLLARRRFHVRLASAAVAGSRTGDLGPQISRALLGHPDVAVVLVGTADVARLTPIVSVGDDLAVAVARLCERGVLVIVGTCPDLGAAPAFAQPLRAIIGWRGRRVADAQAAAARAGGGIPVDLAAATGRIFRADRGAFCEDRLHPSGDGYRLWAEALAPAIAPTGQPVPA